MQPNSVWMISHESLYFQLLTVQNLCISYNMHDPTLVLMHLTCVLEMLFSVLVKSSVILTEVFMASSVPPAKCEDYLMTVLFSIYAMSLKYIFFYLASLNKSDEVSKRHTTQVSCSVSVCMMCYVCRCSHGSHSHASPHAVQPHLPLQSQVLRQWRWWLWWSQPKAFCYAGWSELAKLNINNFCCSFQSQRNVYGIYSLSL